MTWWKPRAQCQKKMNTSEETISIQMKAALRDFKLKARTLCLSQMKVVKKIKKFLKLTQHVWISKSIFYKYKRGDGWWGGVNFDGTVGLI